MLLYICLVQNVSSSKIYLIRHALKDKFSIYGDPDFSDENYKWGLSPRGKKDAKELAEEIRTLYLEKKSVPLIFASPFLRCIQTALPIAKILNTKINVEHGLFEPFHGFPEKTEIENFFILSRGNKKKNIHETKSKDTDNDEMHTKYQNDYESVVKHIEFFKSGSMYKATLGENFENLKIIHQMYEHHRKMANILRKIQKETNKDIIVISHQKEMYEIGMFLENPFERFQCTEVNLDKMVEKWYCGTMIEYNKNDEKYSEGKIHHRPSIYIKSQSYIENSNSPEWTCEQYGLFLIIFSILFWYTTILMEDTF